MIQTLPEPPQQTLFGEANSRLGAITSRLDRLIESNENLFDRLRGPHPTQDSTNEEVTDAPTPVSFQLKRHLSDIEYFVSMLEKQQNEFNLIV